MRLSSTCISKSKMAAGGEAHFAKKLAHNEKKIRDRAVTKLRAWIRSRPKDRPELALNISQLILSFRNEQSAVLFIKTFFKTIQKEWHGIDRLRLDKFYLLIRFFVKETFNFLKKTGWEDRLVTEVSSTFHEEPLNPTSQAVPDGIRLHMVAVYLTELESVVDEQVSSDVLLKLLDPLFLLVAHSSNKTVTNAVKKSLFEHIVQSETDESDKMFTNKVDFAAAADRLFTLGSDREILGRNRNQLFEWAKRLRKCSKGEHKDGEPVQEEEPLNGVPVGSKRKTTVTASELSNITNGTVEDDGGETNHFRAEKVKRKRRKHVEDEIEQGNRLCGSHLSIEEKKEKAKKRENKEESLGYAVSSLCEEDMTVEEVKVEPKKKKKKKSVSGKNDKITVSKKPAKHNHENIEELDIVNGNNNDDDVLQLNNLLTNGSSANDTPAVNGNATGSPEKSDLKSSTTIVEKKILRKVTSPNSEPFAKFQKNSTPPAFVRKCLFKTPKSEPQRSKMNNKKGDIPGSVPAKGTRKRVRIEVSKNTAHTTQDYDLSLKQSPKIPFDAEKTPTQGLLKSPPLTRRTSLRIKKSASFTDPGKRQQKQSKTQRAKAVDFF